MKKNIELNIIKGLGILFVIIVHMMNASGVSNILPTAVQTIVNSISVPVMTMFLIMSGYTYNPGERSMGENILRRLKRLLLPYYLYLIPILLTEIIIYLFIEKRSLAWFADGLIGVVFQYQSLHIFDTSISYVHPMFYPVLVGWFVFQLAVGYVLFVPLVQLIKDKKSYFKLILACVSFALGALFYVLDLQGLNGEFFPTVCKIFIIPNIFGTAGFLLLGYFLRDFKFMEFDDYSIKRKIITSLICLAYIVLICATDDNLYDYPIGKWGAFGAFSYLTGPVYGLALLLVLGILSSLIHKCEGVTKIILFLGDNTMDILLSHINIAFIIAYIGGFWHYYISGDSIPTDVPSVNVIHFVVLLALTLLALNVLIYCKKRFLTKKDKA